MRVVVVGAGWAGLAAAVYLADRGHHPVLLEAAREPGGRARSVRSGNVVLDNGQHLIVGAYTTFLGLLETIGLPESKVLLRKPLRIHSQAPTEHALRLGLPVLPAPLHLLAALGLARGLSTRDRYRALGMGYRLWRNGFQIPEETTVIDLLHRHHQTKRLIERLWGPLCLAALNTHVDRASARVFLRVLRDSFLHRRHDSDFLFPKVGIGDLFPRPAADFVARRGGEIHYGYRVTRLVQERTRITGVIARGETFAADQVILAAPPKAAAHLLATAQGTEDVVRRIESLDSAPIATLYLQYPVTVRMASPMLALTDGPAQWLFDRGLTDYPGMLAAVISGPGEHESWDRDTLIERVRQQLRRLFPAWPAPGHCRLIREKEATFDCVAHVDHLRPGYRTDLPGLLLAGDYTNTGYPGTLEGAVRSGVRCARSLAGGIID